MKSMLNKKSFPEDIGTIISRSWRLYRMNFFSFFSFSLIFSTILAIGFPIKLLILKEFIARNYLNLLFISSLELFYLFLLIASYIFTCSALIKTTYKILCKNSILFIDTFLETSTNFGQKTVFFMNLSFEMLLFTIIDLFLYFSSFAAIAIFLRTIDLNVLNYIFFYLGLTFINIFFFILLIVEVFLLVMQAIIYILEEKSFKEVLFSSLNILFLNPQKGLFFAFVLTIVWLILLLYFYLPFAILSFIFNTYDSSATTIYYIIVTLINGLFLPFLVIGYTLYYYYTEVYTRGLDLIERIANEKAAC